MKKLSKKEQIKKIYDELSNVTGGFNVVIYKDDKKWDWYPTYLEPCDLPKGEYILIPNHSISNYVNEGFEDFKNYISCWGYKL